MTHELESILKAYQTNKNNGMQSVLATVVDLDGSSYRKPGVRMLIDAHQKTVGAVSGGCVEKDIVSQAQKVFESGEALIMTYDGRYRLGCEGVLYILIEPLELPQEQVSLILRQIKARKPLKIKSSYRREVGTYPHLNTRISGEGFEFSVHHNGLEQIHDRIFTQVLSPKFKLLIIGAEHDAVALSQMASQLGWSVEIIASQDEQKELSYFESASELHLFSYEQIKQMQIDKNTAVVLMTHSLQKDLQYLIALENKFPVYFGLLGPRKRKEELLNKLIELKPEFQLDYVDQFKGPTGLDIGAQSAHEIALAILAEILSVSRKKDARTLSQKKGAIHD